MNESLNESETLSERKESERVSLRCDAARRVNFASAQNDVAIIKGITVVNPTDEGLEDLRITLRAVPPIIREKTWVVDRVAPNSEFSVGDLSTPLDIERLGRLDEAELGKLELRMEVPGFQAIVEERRVDLLARDEWGGVDDMVKTLAAFVSPNDPAVADILKAASRLLEKGGRDGSLDGYQSGDPGRVYMLASAIWSAATSLGLTYAEPPASFEEKGQKIRGPGRIVGEGLATCLDSSLFLAAAFEAAGLNSLVLFSRGHAWVGVWLSGKAGFGHVTEPDVVAVRKSMQVHEFAPVETTLLTRRPAVRFDEAVDEGRRRLAESRDPDFVMAVDIARARASCVRPLASHRIADLSESPEAGDVAPAPLPPPPDFGLLPSEIIDEEPETPQGRIERWHRKLLDLSLRNRLLNYRDGKRTLPLRCPNVAVLEDRLASGEKFRAFSLIDNDPIGDRKVSPEERRRIEEDVVRGAFERAEISVPLSGHEMDARLLGLHRGAKSDMQEGGTNTLFLAAGFLRWKRIEGEARVYRAPLILIPVRLARRSSRSPFQLSYHEDDVRINSTLLEFLKRDFNLRIHELEGDLPLDESGIDVKRILGVMRRKVLDIAGFEVVEELALATFSFAKYLMWKDLVDREDQLKSNRLVEYLIDGSDETYAGAGGGAPIKPREIDRRCSPRDVLTPLPADSSQLAAILAASEGRDFILVGPPGTGKSQTITNIIAQCLSEGKTVLFVAEKAAALDVVQRRLVTTGLGDAVLELHSNKTERRSVIKQLGRGWDRASGNEEETWIDVSDRLRLHRDQLNAYVEALHARGSQGFSVSEAIALAAPGKPAFDVAFADKDAHDEKSYERLASLAVDLARTHAAVGAGPSLQLIHGGEWSFQWEREILDAAESFRSALDKLRRVASALARELGLRDDPGLAADRRERLKALAPRAERGAADLSLVPDIPAERLVAEADAFAMCVRELAAARSEALATYSLETVRRMPLDRLDMDWREAQARFWPLSVFSKRKVRKLLRGYADDGAADPDVDLKALFRMREFDAAIRESPLLPVASANGEVDARRMTEAVRHAVRLRAALVDLEADIDDSSRLEAAAVELGSSAGGAVRNALGAYLEVETEVDDEARRFERAGGARPDGASVEDLDAGLALVVEERGRLQDWTIWRKKSEEGMAAGLGPLIEALESGRAEGDAEDAFRRAYAFWWLPLAIDASDELRGFAYWRHEDIVKAFREIDDQAMELAAGEVMRRVAHGLPARDGVSRKSELGVLRHQLGLKRPSMPIRQLLASLPESFGKLAPCVLMSPLSIAQYLPADQAAFDVVIFDEASQITTWDAIGAIARGRQTIIVGDPKQLPPTNFFGRVDEEDEDLPEIERDMPSILDEVAVAGVSRRDLTWHYRSRDEALIAFSNHFYYGGRLVTFPAPAPGSGALQFHKVDGVYERGGARANRAEAKAVAEMARRRLTEWLDDPEDERQTLGIITFNIQQQSLILDLLDEIRRDDGALEWFFSDQREEPVIVKNLENIQGDERDVMLFSVTFGPDLAGKLTMNFGPINNEGGEKRLNVAITRARREFHVFSSIRADQIDLGRTRATGVRHLKGFLDYAERGEIALPAQDEGSLGPAENPFEEAVAAAFRRKGWEVRTQIGVSGFRVDLGVVHPDRAGRYLAGIECDGARYHSSATARDRDKIRQAVLEGLGWNILRVWSTNWFRDSGEVVDRLHRELERLLKEDRKARPFEDPARSETGGADPNSESGRSEPAPSSEGGSMIAEGGDGIVANPE